MAVLSLPRDDLDRAADPMPLAEPRVARSGGSMAPRRVMAQISQGSTDAELADAVIRCDQSGLAEMYRRHGAAVFGLACRVLGDRSLAEDVTQEVFLRMWNEPTRFDPQRGALRSFLQREVHSRSIERVRSEEARRKREQRSHEGIDNFVEDLEATVVASIESEELAGALSSLDPRDREAIELAYFGGLSYREVAARLNQPEGTVKSRIRSGLRKLSTMITDVEMEAER